MADQINLRYALLPKSRMKLRLALAGFLLCLTSASSAQRVTSFDVSAGAVWQEDAALTAAFSIGAGLQWKLPWTLWLQRSVADLETGGPLGTVRDISFAILPAWEPFGGNLLLAAGPALHHQSRDVVGADDDSNTRITFTGIAGVRIPVAGEAVSLQILVRGDALQPEPQGTALFGVHIRRGARSMLSRGEPMPARAAAAHAAVWNDVLMQLILLQQSLESFTRIKEIETGIELEFDLTAVTLFDDVAKTARVLAAADPPVMITVFAPNAGRTGAAVTAGSFPAERLRLQRDTRVYLRVER
jgi:hypothetical protein